VVGDDPLGYENMLDGPTDVGAGSPGPYVKNIVLRGTYGDMNVTLKGLVFEPVIILAFVLQCVPLGSLLV
jgi:hypothetical protein